MTEEVNIEWSNAPTSFYINIDDRALIFKVFGVPIHSKGKDYKNLIVQLAKEKDKELIVKNG